MVVINNTDDQKKKLKRPPLLLRERVNVKQIHRERAMTVDTTDNFIKKPPMYKNFERLANYEQVIFRQYAPAD